MEKILVCGATANNLKNLSCEIPHDCIVVITGSSGSGKSTLALQTICRSMFHGVNHWGFGDSLGDDTVLLEGHRYVIRARDFHSFSENELLADSHRILNLLSQLLMKYGEIACAECGYSRGYNSSEMLLDRMVEFGGSSQLVVKGLAGGFSKSWFERHGVVKFVFEGEYYQYFEIDELAPQSVVFPVLEFFESPPSLRPFSDLIERGYELGDGNCYIFDSSGNLQSECWSGKSCENCNAELIQPSAETSVCSDCNGRGSNKFILQQNLFSKTTPLEKSFPILQQKFLKREFGLVVDYCKKHCKGLTQDGREDLQRGLLFGSESEKFWEALIEKIKAHRGDVDSSEFIELYGIVGLLGSFYSKTSSKRYKSIIESYLSPLECESCSGSGLGGRIQQYHVSGMGISSLLNFSSSELRDFLDGLESSALKSSNLLEDLKESLSVFEKVLLSSIPLSTRVGKLSAAELNLLSISEVFSVEPSGALIVFDEPLAYHNGDERAHLWSLFGELRDAGNSIIVVEHDSEAKLKSDYFLELGPHGGDQGGELVDFGPGLKGDYVGFEVGKMSLDANAQGESEANYLVFNSIDYGRIKNFDLKFPLNSLVCLTGEKGSGKSILIEKIIYPTVLAKLNNLDSSNSFSSPSVGEFEGLVNVSRVVMVASDTDMSSARTTVAVKIGVWDEIRRIFSRVPEASAKGLKPSDFSYSSSLSRCSSCHGSGVVKGLERCVECQGFRYGSEVQSFLWRGRSIADISAMTVSEAANFFRFHPKIYNKLRIAESLFAGYLCLGQRFGSVSLGESRRIQLARELEPGMSGDRTLFLIDSPCHGLGQKEVRGLVSVFRELVSQGHSVFMVEQNPEALVKSDFVLSVGLQKATGNPEIVKCGWLLP